jgi:hypothetical protein
MKDAISLIQRRINISNANVDYGNEPIIDACTSTKTQERLSSISAKCDALTRTQEIVNDAAARAQVRIPLP